jgi:hypothetical protein
MPAAPADFVAGSHVTGIPQVLPSGPGPPVHGSSADERHRESVRDMFAMELALHQLNGDSGRVLNNMQQACSGCGSQTHASSLLRVHGWLRTSIQLSTSLSS